MDGRPRFDFWNGFGLFLFTPGSDQSEDQDVGGRMGSEWILGRSAAGVDWIRMTRDMDRWRAVVIAVMNLPVLAPELVGIIL
jgi:hypothetical protein